MTSTERKRLNDRVAIVTGANSGIGKATALRFLGEGAAVAGIDRHSDSMEELAAAESRFESCRCDLKDHAGLQKTVAEVLERHGKIDILANIAGLSHYATHGQSTLAQWQETFTVNVEAMYVLAKLVTPSMIENRYGQIVNVSSTQSMAASPEVSSYAGSKGAVNAWSRALAVELAEHDILVNAVAPGCIHTPMSVIKGIDETTDPAFIEWYQNRRKIPLARPGQAHEIASVILFLSTDECSYVTGHTLVADGGLTITF